MNAAKRLLRCGKLAQLAGVSPDTIRHYERLGTLPTARRASSGHRIFAPEALDRARMARQALQLGFTLGVSQIAVMKGAFSAPKFVHDGVPSGVTTMKLLHEKIRYRYEELASGGKVFIESEAPIARAAIHDFLRFQINEHPTGDSLEPEGAGK